MLIPYRHPTYDLQGRCELDSSSAAFWFPHPIVDTRLNKEWKKRECMVMNKLSALSLSQPMMLVRTDVVDVLIYGEDLPEEEMPKPGSEDIEALAVIQGELVLPEVPLDVVDEVPLVLVNGEPDGSNIISVEDSLKEYAARNLLRRYAASISTIYKLPLTVG